jgi:TrmH family RNA methyltransferase
MLDRCTVVLVGPMFGGNVGAAARAIKNTGLGGLKLVDPRYENQREAEMFSHGAEEILASATTHETLVESIAQQERVVGFTVRERHRRAMTPLRRFAETWVEESLDGAPPSTALLFGRERDGLTNEELDLCSDIVWIPSHPEHPSYNLAQAVLLAGYELFVARLSADPRAPRVQPRQTKRPSPAPMAEAQEIEAMLSHLRSAFLEVGYGYVHTVDHLIRSYAEIFARARLHRREAAMIRGMAHQILWAARRIQDLEAKEEPEG